MSEITLALEHPSLGCGEIIARYDLSKIQEKAYQQGRADKYQEIVSEYMLLTEKQVADTRADVIDELVNNLIDEWTIESLASEDDAKTIREIILSRAERLKGRNNE